MMKSVLRSTIMASLALVLLSSTLICSAQPRGGRGDFDPEQMRQRMMEGYQEMLGFSNEEWKVIQPLVEDVMEKQRETRSFGFGGFRFFGGMRGPRPGGDEGDRPDRGNRRGFRGEPDPEIEALQEVLESEDAPAEQIKSKLDALRNARKAKEAALKKSQEKLQQVLTVRQEAMCVLMRLLE